MAGSITYGTLEELNVSLGSGGDSFTVSNTHGSATGGFEETTTLRSGGGNDIVTIDDVTDRLTVYGEADSDTITVNGNSLGSNTVLYGDGGSDVFNIRDISADTTVNGGDGSDTVNVGSNSLGTPGAPSSNSGGNVNAINGKLTVYGNGSDTGTGDVLNIDETGETLTNTGYHTGTRIWGLGMPGSSESAKGITYGSLEDLNINLGAGGNNYYIQGSHLTTTTLDAGSGPLNKVYVGSVSGAVRPIASSTINQIGGHLILNGQSPDSELFIDNSGETNAGTGKLEETEFTHSSTLPDSCLPFSSFN